MRQKIVNFTPLEKLRRLRKSKFLDSLTGFIKYHNGFTIILALVFVIGASAFASSDVRDAVIGKAIVTSEGINNSTLLAADLNNFNLAMTITGVSEDSLNYYIDYQFKTLGVESDVWQELSRQLRMTVSKEALSGHDLGLYVQEQLSQIANNELSFLKEAQNNEKKKGETQIVQTTEYTGLIGLVLDVKNNILPGYKPVIAPPEIVVQPNEQVSSPSQDENLIQQLQSVSNVSGNSGNSGANTNQQPAPASVEPTSTTSEPEATSTEPAATTTQQTCIPDWSCSDWGENPSLVLCGNSFTQTRVCTDSNSCPPAQGGQANDGKPAETQSASGVKCEASNATGICQSGTCNFTCAEGFSNCDSNWLNGCEIQLETPTSTCPTL